MCSERGYVEPSHPDQLFTALVQNLYGHQGALKQTGAHCPALVFITPTL